MIIAMSIFGIAMLFFILSVTELFFGTNENSVASVIGLKFQITFTFIIAVLSAQYIWG